MKWPNYSLSSKSKAGSGDLLRAWSEALGRKKRTKSYCFSIWIIKWERALGHHRHRHKQATFISCLDAAVVSFSKPIQKTHKRLLLQGSWKNVFCLFVACVLCSVDNQRSRDFFFLVLDFLSIKLLLKIYISEHISKGTHYCFCEYIDFLISVSIVLKDRQGLPSSQPKMGSLFAISSV